MAFMACDLVLFCNCNIPIRVLALLLIRFSSPSDPLACAYPVPYSTIVPITRLHFMHIEDLNMPQKLQYTPKGAPSTTPLPLEVPCTGKIHDIFPPPPHMPTTSYWLVAALLAFWHGVQPLWQTSAGMQRRPHMPTGVMASRRCMDSYFEV